MVKHEQPPNMHIKYVNMNMVKLYFILLQVHSSLIYSLI